MDLERRGILSKLKQSDCYMKSRHSYQINLIDTPGHVDFSYEVSRSLSACDGVILVVDATQGIEAQSIAHTSLALNLNLKVIPVINKIDLPSADVESVKKDLSDFLKIDKDEIIEISAKTGVGIKKVLPAVIKSVPSPSMSDEKFSKSLS